MNAIRGAPKARKTEKTGDMDIVDAEYDMPDHAVSARFVSGVPVKYQIAGK